VLRSPVPLPPRPNMFRSALTILVAASLLAQNDARAEQPALPPRHEEGINPGKDADAYCRWVKAVAASSADVLVAPSLYATGGYVSGADISLGASAVSPTSRVIAAAAYSVGGLNRGLAELSHADAECHRYRAAAQLHAYVERNRDAISVRAFTAKANVLDGAVAHAQEILAQEKALLAQFRLTVDEFDGTQLRVDGLRQNAADAHQKIASVAAAPLTPRGSIRKAVADRDDAEVAVERAEGRVRASNGWDLVLRGGVDKIFGVTTNAPYFAMATLSINLGWLFQGSANSDARDARRDWVRAQVEGDDDRITQVLERLRSVRDEEVARLRETTTLLADLDARYKSVAAVGGEKARAFADFVWFDLVRVEADHAYFAEHVRELSELIGNEGTP
jgi:hypothetical protein